MRHIGLLLTILTTIVVSSLGQTRTPKYYCQGCCGGVGVYYLKLDSANKFELYYLVGEGNRDDSSFGIGTFNVKSDLLTLSFNDIPHDGVELRKTNISDSLIVHFYVFDIARSDSVALINVKLKTGKEFFYPQSTGTIKMKFRGPETINFSSIGFKDLTYSLTEPGEYEMRVKLNPEGKTYLKQGDKKEFKIITTNTTEWFQDVSDKNLKFTTKSCGR
jgi:hypothetical protein